MVERDRKSLRMARFCGFAISTAFLLDGPALGATHEGARTSPAAGAAPITAGRFTVRANTAPGPPPMTKHTPHNGYSKKDVPTPT